MPRRPRRLEDRLELAGARTDTAIFVPLDASGAESVFSAEPFAKALLQMADLAILLGEVDEAERYRREHAELTARVNQCAWDGEWYLAYFDAHGRPFGSRQNKHAQIYLYPQAWAVIGGIAPLERGRRAMDSVQARLSTAHGIRLSAPGFDGHDPAIGGITTHLAPRRTAASSCAPIHGP